MAKFQIANPISGQSVFTAKLKDYLIDSDYPTMFCYSFTQSSHSIPSSGTTNVQFPIPGTWLPYGFFFTDQDGNHNTAGKYYFQKNNGGVGFVAEGWTPMFNPGTLQYTGWQYIWIGTGSVHTANYMTYISYQQSDGLFNNSTSTSITPPCIAVAVGNQNVNSVPIRQLAFYSGLPMTQIAKEVVITLNQTGNGGVSEASFAHGLGQALPFLGFITNSTIWGSNTINFSTANLLLSSNFETFDFAMDGTNFYLDINNSQNAVNYSTSIHVYFIRPNV